MSKHNRRSMKRRLNCEPLEDRRLLAVVTTTIDGGPGSLRDAIDDNATLVTFDPSLDGATIQLEIGQLNIDNNVTIDGEGMDITISAADANANLSTMDKFRLFFISDNKMNKMNPPEDRGINVILRDLKLTGGVDYTIEGGLSRLGGAAIRIEQGENVLLENVTIFNNRSADAGGGISISDFTDAQPYSTADTDTVLVIKNSTITGNEGGGIAADFLNPYFSTGKNTIQIDETTISRNFGFSGVDVDVQNRLDFTMSNSTVSDNNKFGDGRNGGVGGLRFKIAGTIRGANSVLINNSTISGNRGTNVGGLSFSASNSHASYPDTIFEMNQSTISGNIGEQRNGAMYVGNIESGPDGKVLASINNSTIYNNWTTATDNITDPSVTSAVVFRGDSVTPVVMNNTIVSGNIFANASIPPNSPGYSANLHTSFTNEAGEDYTGEGNSVNDATTGILGQLMDNGGDTKTHEPFDSNSPVVDAGAAGGEIPTFPFDQRDAIRVQGAGIDIGSVEFDGVASQRIGPKIIDVIMSTTGSSHLPYSFGDDFDSGVISTIGDQLKTVPVALADKISIQFDKDIIFNEQIGMADWLTTLTNLRIFETRDLGSVTYDPDTFTATWDYGIGFDVAMGVSTYSHYRFEMSDLLTSVDGVRLDGEWETPSDIDDSTLLPDFVSGDGTELGDFDFVFSIMPWDADRNTKIGGPDFTALAVNFGPDEIAAKGAFEKGDGNGDLMVNGADFTGIAFNFGNMLGDVPEMPLASTQVNDNIAAVDLFFSTISEDEDESDEGRRERIWIPSL